MNKETVNKYIYKITDFTNLQNIGGGWVGMVKQYLPQSAWLDRAATLQIWLWALHINWIPIWIVAVFLGFKYYFMLWLNWYIAKRGIDAGVYDAQVRYGAMTKHLAPVGSEIIQQLEAIGDSLKIESKITKL